LKAGEVKEYRAALDRVRALADRHAGARGEGARELHRIAAWILNQWAGPNADLLQGKEVAS
jgi:hypothetical protein